jgi:anaerobic dimethyl sulfoxide reductase subunit A
MTDGKPVACNRDCGATCALMAETRSDGSIRLVRNPMNPSLKTPCPRGLRALDSRNAADRLRRPLIRTGRRGDGVFKEVSWSTALRAAAEGLKRIIHDHGAPAILDFGGSGACKGALHNTGRLTAAFLGQLGPVTGMEGSYSFQAANFALPYVYGTGSIGYDAGTLLDTRFVILWGANIADTRFGNESRSVMRHIRSQGGEIVVIDPRRTETSRQLGTQWIPIRPGGDVPMMLAIAHVLLTEGLVDDRFLSTYVHGADDFFTYITGDIDGIPKTPEWASALSGVPAETILDLARRYAAARPAAIVPGFSLQRAMGGEETFRMTAALQAVTGNAGIHGGTPGTNMWFGLPGPKIRVFPGRDGGGRTVPKAIWPQVILGGKAQGYPADFKAAYMVGTNYLNQGSDILSGITALESLEFIVSHELFMTPSARYADIVFPATHFLEREDVIIAEDNYLYYSGKVLEPIGEARDDFDVFADLSSHLGLKEEFSRGRTSSEWVDWIIDHSAVGREGREEFKKTGIHDGGNHNRNGLDPFISDPVANPLNTPSGKIEISSERYAETGFPAWPHHRTINRNPDYPLQLITPHSRLRINSTGSNIAWVEENDPILLWMNPSDARKHGIIDGSTVLVRSSAGEMTVKVCETPIS